MPAKLRTFILASTLLFLSLAACSEESVQATAALPEVEPGNLAFGQVEVGTPRELVAQVVNRGAGSVLISSVDVGGPDAIQFSASLARPRVDGGQQVALTVRYLPDAVATHEAFVQLGGVDPPLRVALTGEGIAAPCTDADMDGYGEGCDLGPDCDDANTAINPAATADPCDGVDNDCDAATDEDAGIGAGCSTGEMGACNAGTTTCENGVVGCAQAVQPTAEVCNGADDDCDGDTDEELSASLLPCETGEPGICGAGRQVCFEGQVQCYPDRVPGEELCNQLDDDCDGLTDEGEDPGSTVCAQCTDTEGCDFAVEACLQGPYDAVRSCRRFCASGAECPAGEACRTLDEGANLGFCHAVPDTALAVHGQICSANSDCADDFCSSLTQTCLQRCAADRQCPQGYVCQSVLNRGLREGRCSAGPLISNNGNACTGDNQCISGHCLFVPGFGGVCRPTCCSLRDCTANQVCGFVDNSGASAMLGCIGQTNAGLPIGAACTGSNQCDSGFCSEQSNTCTDFCCDDSDCPATHTCTAFLTDIKSDLIGQTGILTAARLCERR